MSDQVPPPGQQPAGYGYPPQGRPGYGYPPPPQPKKSSAGKIVGFSCLGVVGVFVLIGIVAALVSDGGTTGPKDSAAPAASASQPAKGPGQQAPAAPEKKAAVSVAAEKAEFKKSVLADGDGYTSVAVTVTNNSSKPINVNPLYFTITDTSGTKHVVELGAAEDQIDTVELAPGENVTGAVTGKGTFTPKTVTYTDGLIGKGVRTDVS
ncbi:DUF4352 domain-containing protein [Streptomyces sp. NBC_01565]|uniref:DUF4352 domain-containing protein n=1 Tax=Streptomyces sp. NBC_01565 TaxID=2975881 RepID=UPI00224FFEA4|nr:DUF4352 domain-containing protein [Streptomyces sp. NBC_01565]MCX4539701.1 DUF4352 domain-containing protein [Streptomyces sp. NBC_01565]